MIDEIKFISSAITDGVILIDSSYSVLFCSEPGAGMIGISASAAVKSKLYELFPELKCYLHLEEEQSEQLFEETISSLDGRELPVSLLAGIKRLFHFGAHTFRDDEKLVGYIVFSNLSKSREFDELRKDFMDSMSHELRTPISTIKTYTATLSHPKAAFDRKTQLEFLSIIDSEANKLSRIVDSIFEASRMARHRLTLKYEPVNIQSVVEEAMEAIYIPSTHRIVITSEQNQDIYADREQLLYAFIHILNNAIKFSPDGGEVHVDITEKGQKDCILICIEDHGIGIPFDLQDKIFEAFFKVDIGTTKKMYSVGMGLFIIKKIIEAHGGCLWVESVLNRGSKFFFLLPKNSYNTVNETCPSEK